MNRHFKEYTVKYHSKEINIGKERDEARNAFHVFPNTFSEIQKFPMLSTL